MAINKTKILKKAEKFIKSGKLAQAAEQYKILVDDNPDDPNNLKKLGEVYVKMNNNADGIDCFRKVAEHYAREGFILKAIAMYKMSTNADPTLLDIKLKLADLYSQQGLTMEAKSLYFAVAEKYAEEGMKDQSIELYNKLLEIEPDNLQYRVKLADLYTDKNKVEEALGEYKIVGDKLLSQNMVKEATKVFKKALGIDSSNVEMLSALARAYSESDDHESAISLFEDLLKKDGENVEVLIQLGNVYLKTNNLDKAEKAFMTAVSKDSERVDSLLELARILIKKSDLDRAWKVYNAVVECYKDKNNFIEAIGVLEEYIDLDSSHVDALTELASICDKSGDEQVTKSSYDKLAQAYISRKMYQEASEVLENLLKIEPDNIQHQEKLEFVRAKLGTESVSDIEIDDLEGVETVENEIEIDEIDGEGAHYAGEEDSEPVEEKTKKAKDFAKLMETDDDVISEYLTEAEVFVKYGLVTKAIDRLAKAKDDYPDSIDLRSKLLEIYREQGNKEESVSVCVEMANIFKNQGNDSAALEIIEDAKEIDPNSSLIQAYESGEGIEMSVDLDELESLEEEAEELEDEVVEIGDAEATVKIEEDDLDEAFDDEDFDFEIDDDIEEVGVEEELDVTVDYAGDAEETELEPVEDDKELELEEVSEEDGELPEEIQLSDDDVEFDLDEEEAEIEVDGQEDDQVEIVDIEEDESFELDIEDEELDFDISEEEADDVEEEDVATINLEALEKDHKTAVVGEENELSAELKEIEALEKAGKKDVALEKVTLLAMEHPTNEAVQNKLHDLSTDDTDGEEGEDLFDLGTLADDDDIEGDFFDIGSEVEDIAFGSDGDSGESEVVEEEEENLENILGDFRQGIQEQFSDEDYETHYNLGIAYMEMGLTDEALTEFQIAAKDPERTVDCASMLGIGFMEKGLPAQAINWFKKGLEVTGEDSEGSLGLKYDLALAFEANGENGEALALFEEVSSVDSAYREVEEKIQILKEMVME